MKPGAVQDPPSSRSSLTSWVLLWIGVLGAGASAILIRYADGADPLAISFWRCFLGTAVLAPFARFGQRKPDRTELRASVIAGGLLAIHFAAWITSVGLTSIAESVLLVSMAPVFVAVGARFLWNDRLHRAGWIGIALAIAGTALVGSGGGGGESSLEGNLLALLGAASVGGYMMAGTVARRSLGIVQYAVIAYSVAAVILFPLCLIAGAELWAYPAQTWWALAGIVVGPQLLGHTLINLVLDDLDTTTVSVTIMAEPIIAIVAGYVLFSEAPSALVYPGAALLLFGIYLVTALRNRAAVILE